MAIKPQRATLDKYIDAFSDWDVQTQEQMMDDLGLAHRLSRRNALRAARERDDSQSQPEVPGEAA